MLANGAQIQLQVLYSDTVWLVQVALQKDMKSALKPLKNAKTISACGGLLPPAAPAAGLQILRLHTRFRTVT